LRRWGVLFVREQDLMPRYRFAEPTPTEITPRSIWLDRRNLIAAMAAGAALPLVGASTSAALPAATRWPQSSPEPQTRPDVATGYCNFFEYGPKKDDPSKGAHLLRPDPWSITVDGLVDRPGPIAMEDMLARFALEERVYRLRCVEAWSMVIPWIGFPLGALLGHVGLASGAAFVEFQTLHDPVQMPMQSTAMLDWPYREGLRLDEAMHPLTLLAVGMYGKPLPAQNGAPIRLVVPWKYGFKSIKSIVRIHVRADQPVSTWQAKAPREYGFYANVNPAVRHPRWHQATERRLHDGERIRTEPFNGYAAEVAHLYAGMDLVKNH
jgi:sulfoxide reductase catalytic subunit YedY